MIGQRIGELVPVVMLPRFTSYVGPSMYATVPMRVEQFEFANVIFWRGPLVGGAASTPFQAYFEESHDAVTWTATNSSVSQPVTAVNQSDPVMLTFLKRWFRVRVDLRADAQGVVAISLWMVGALSRRVD